MYPRKGIYTTRVPSSVLAMGSLVLAAAGNTPSPNEPIPKPMCNSSNPLRVRYAETTGRLYLESAGNDTRGGCVSLGAIWEARDGKGTQKLPRCPVCICV